MSVLGKTLGFSVLLTLVFTLVANLLPQVEGEAPEEQRLDLGALTMDSFVALGERLVMGKGTCTLCHKPPPLGRAPDILGENLVQVASERLADPRYRGKATTPGEYIHESMMDPSVYVVAGWGKKGSNDTVSPMPRVDKAPIGLSDVEMDAVIAYLESKDGNQVTVSLPTEAPAALAAETGAVGGGAGPAPAKSPEEAVKKYGCQACHSLLGSGAALGPALDDVGSRLSADRIRQSILDPNAEIAEGFSADTMPADFADRMTVKELEMIVDLLSRQQ